MSTFGDLNTSIQNYLISQNMSDITDNPFINQALTLGLQEGSRYLGNYLQQRRSNSLSRQINKAQKGNVSNVSSSVSSMVNRLGSPPQLTPPSLKQQSAQINSQSISLSPTLSSNQNMSGMPTDFGIELKAPDTQNYSTKSDFNIKGAAGGQIGGYIGGQIGNVLGNTIFGNSKAGQMATGTLSTAGSNIASTAGGQIASGSTINLGSLGSAANIVSSAAGLGNIAFDVFDPVEKSGWEKGVGAGLAVASAIPGVGIVPGLLNLGFNAVGHLGGEKARTFTADTELLSEIGSSFGSSVNKIMKAQSLSGKKFSMWNKGGLHGANNQMNEADRQQKLMEIIGDYNSDRRFISQSTSAINHNRYALDMQGGLDQSAIRVGKKGLKISPKKAREITRRNKIKKIQDEVRAEEVAGFQEGGKTPDPFQVYLSTLPKNQKDSTNYRVRDYWEFNGKPKNFEEALSKGMFTKDKKGFYHASSVAENPETGEIEYMKTNNHPTRYMESDWYEKGLIYNDDGSATQLNPGMDGYENWKNFVSNYELIKSEPYWKYVKRTSKTPEFKEGGSIIELTSFIEPISPDDIPEFKEGGSINVIPEGALHARKHNMDMEGITKKGIPVVSNDGEQQAEVEREEIIFRLEVTQKLEELQKKFYNEEISKKEKDELALEAGKLLAYEILHNTQDNTNNLL